jgi:putative MATE family efflux protein
VKVAKKERDLTNGPLFVPIFTYVIPIILTGLLQVVYNMADTIVVGQFSGDELALSAVGSTSALFNLIINLLMGVAGGSAVVVAQSFGAKEYDKLSSAVHTSMLFSIFGGIAFLIFGLAVSEPALILMKTKAELFSRALLYFRIICVGIPALGVYNFGAAILRSVGDSKTPLFILSSTGIINVLLNLFFVIVCNMAVEGVALATIISQYVSAIVVVIILIKRVNTPYALDPKKLSINFEILKKILLLGLPAGLQGTLFSISNIILTSGINELDEIFIRGKTIAINIEGLVYTSMNSYLHASTAFTGQNYGAKKIDRVKKSIIYSVIQVTIVGFVGGQILNFFGEPLANLYIGEDWSNKQEVINVARELMNFMLSCYFLCGIMDTISGALRGLGYSMIPMIISIGAICVLRAIWVQFFFPMEQFHSLIGIYTIYPISWSIGLIALTVAIIIVYKKVKKRLTNEDLPPLPKTA